MKLEKLAIGGEEKVGVAEVAEIDVLEERMSTMSNNVMSHEITDNESYQKSARMLHSVEEVFSVIDAVIERFRAPAYDYYKSVLAEKKRLLGPGEKAKAHLRKLMGEYMAEQERVRAAEEKKLIAAAKVEAEEKALEALERAMEAGDDLGAELAIESASATPEVDRTALKELTPNAEGIQVRSSWKAGFEGDTDGSMRKLCAAIGAGRVSVDLVTLNTSKANQLARALKGAMRVPGLVAVEDKTIVRGRS